MTYMDYSAILDTVPVIKKAPAPIVLLRTRVSTLLENFSRHNADVLFKIITAEDKQNDLKL